MEPAFLHPTRLAVVAFLSGCVEAEFRAVRENCEISEPTLSKLATALESEGHLKIRKGYIGRRPRTWLSLTGSGRIRLDSHLATLQEIAAQNTRNAAILETEPGLSD
ncbi:transcriptional regulator [Nocardia panacis]|uniref:transcriptional regulator n=1 Tax=Nocardia panacis TaxID=2340916 RepID=UPI0019395608|nr:transcriptional regulator [Nocardia panacis]